VSALSKMIVQTRFKMGKQEAFRLNFGDCVTGEVEVPSYVSSTSGSGALVLEVAALHTKHLFASLIRCRFRVVI
jgi:hypothetical protein